MSVQPSPGTDKVLAALEKGGFELGPERSLRRTMLDTFDGRLHGAGLRLELREAPGRELTLSGGGPAAAHVAVAAVPRFASDLPVGPVRLRLSPVLDVRALLPTVSATTRQRVAVRRDKLGKALVSVTVHDGLAIAGSTSSELVGLVVEVDELAGYAKAAESALSLLATVGLQALDTDLMGFVAAAAGVDLRGHTASPTVVLDRNEPSLEAFRRVLANLAGEIDANWEGTVDDVDSEFLHDLRVAVRRTRSVLAQGKGVLPVETRNRFRAGFGWLGGATGPARDLDVYVIEWDNYVGPLGADVATALGPLVRHVAQRRRDEHAALSALLRTARYHELMAAWHGWLASPVAEPDSRADAVRPIGKVAARRITKANDQLVARGRRIGPDTPAEELHELRKDAKKLRYLLECFGALLPAGERKSFVQRLKALQDNLGEHQDTEVHAVELRAMSHDLHDAGDVGPDTLVAIGQLAGEFERRRAAARAEFAEHFAAYDTVATRRTFEALTESATRG
ncbi:MAG: CHAD domain-containing protein [Acidimicrobiia bacterium]|nr:CHAD domain-containing protein [Acidimicrobiia bacterium]